jgi:hypothetical protein
MWVQIRPWGLENNLDNFVIYIKDAALPAFFAPMMWTYIGICIIALLLSLFIKDKPVNIGRHKLVLPQLLIGIVGISFIIVVIAGTTLAYIRTGDFWGTKLVGTTHVVLADNADVELIVETDVHAGFLLGYWTSCVTGPLLVILALLRKKIRGVSAVNNE